MNIKIPANLASITSLADVKKFLGEAFRVIENTLGNVNTLWAVTAPNDPRPSGTDLIAGDLLLDLSVNPPTLNYWNGKLFKSLIVSGTGGGIPEAPTDSQLYGRENAAWVVVPASGIGEAPNDGQLYGRESLGWIPVPAPGISDAPADGTPYDRQDNAWVPATGGGGGSGGFLLVADGIDTPPQTLYTEDGKDWLYAD